MRPGGRDPGFAETRRRCRRIVARLDLPSPFTAAAFIDRLAERRGRPIELIPVRAGVGTPCGLVVMTDRADVIFYASDTTSLHREHILVHEAAHLVCDHRQSAPIDESATRTLLPHLQPDLVKQVLGRVVYTEPQEREAELLASLILSRVHRSAAPARPADAPWSQLDAVFRVPSGHGTADG